MKWRCDEWPHELCWADAVFLIGFFTLLGTVAAAIMSPIVYLVFFR